MTAALRRAWSIDEDQIVVALLGDTPRAMDAMRGLTAAGLAAETGRAIRLLVHPEAPHLTRAQRVAEAMGRSHRLIADERVVEPAQALAGADVALALTGCGRQAIAWAMARRLAIVCDHACDLLEDEHTALIAADRSDRALARAIRRLYDEPALRRRLGSAAVGAITQTAEFRRLVALVQTPGPARPPGLANPPDNPG